MLRAVPITVRTAESRLVVFKSGSLVLAISSTCLRVTLPTLLRFGSADPLTIPAARFSSSEAGGVLVMKVNDAVAVDRDQRRNDHAIGFFGSLGVELLDEIHDVHALRTERGAHGRSRRGFAAGNCSFTVACTFFAIEFP